MNIPTTKQSAIEAMEVLLTATDPADTLRVSESGRVYAANAVAVLFSRAHSAVLQLLGRTGTNVDWQGKARQAVLDMLKRDVELVSGTVSSSDQDRLEELLTDISTPKEGSPQANLRSRLPGKIAALKAHSDTSKLASTLEKLEFFSRPVNTPLLPHLRLHMKGGASLSESLKAGLQSHLVNGLGLSAETAKNASDNIHWAMTNFGCDFKEALDIACCAGDMVRQNECEKQRDTAMSLGLLRVRHGASLAQARTIFHQVRQSEKSPNELRSQINLMLTCNIGFDEADAIVSLAESIAKAEDLNGVSAAQLQEIAWLRLHHDLSPEEAILASLAAGPLSDNRAPRRDAWQPDPKTHVSSLVDQRIAQLSPAGWPEQWESMPDGSRRLTDLSGFKSEYLDFLKDSYKEGDIDTAQGLSTKFLEDAGRTHFRFGTGRDAISVDTDKQKAIDTLTAVIPDPAIRQSLSRCLFQGGANGLIAAMSLSLKVSGDQDFSILAHDPDNDNAKTQPATWISIHMAEEGKIRVGYVMYINHFCLYDSRSGTQLKINSRFNSDKAPSKTDHTAVATGLVEFDVEELRQGLVNPVFVRDPELRLTIEPDRTSIMRKMNEELMSYAG